MIKVINNNKYKKIHQREYQRIKNNHTSVQNANKSTTKILDMLVGLLC